MAKARSREATIAKVVKVEVVEVVVDGEDGLEIRVSGSDQTVIRSAVVKAKIEDDRNGQTSRRQTAE
jgi:glycine cleavage system aminomethyltransferase T